MLFYHAFVDLFPFGRGGLNDPDRKQKLSTKEFLTHLMKLSSLHLVVMFDFKNRELGTLLRLKDNDAF